MGSYVAVDLRLRRRENRPRSAGSCVYCESCGNYTPVADIYRVYEFDDMIGVFENEFSGDPLKVGDEDRIIRNLRALVDEKDVTPCNCGAFATLEEQQDMWECSICDSYRDNPHEALMCCSEPCRTGRCQCRQGLDYYKHEDGDGFYPDPVDWRRDAVFRCWCDDSCELSVCAVCHRFFSGDEPHNCMGSPDPSEPVLDYGKDGCACKSGFCCAAHDIHRVEHTLCEQS